MIPIKDKTFLTPNKTFKKVYRRFSSLNKTFKNHFSTPNKTFKKDESSPSMPNTCHGVEVNILKVIVFSRTKNPTNVIGLDAKLRIVNTKKCTETW